MRAVAVIAAAVALTLSALGGGSAARAEDRATSTLDRTYTCAVFFRGGAYLLDSHAHAGTRRGGAWARLPYAERPLGRLLGRGREPARVDHVRTSGEGHRRRSGLRHVRRGHLRHRRCATRVVPPDVRPGHAFAFGPARRVGRAARQRVRVLRAQAGRRPRSGSPHRAGSPESRAGLRDRARSGARGETRGPHGHGQAAVYADVHDNGKARLFTARACSPQ